MDIDEDLDEVTSPPPGVEVVNANQKDQRQHQIAQGKQRKRQCQLCGLHVADVRALKKHLKSSHQHGKNFWCTQCTYKGISKDSLKKHRLRYHPQPRSDAQEHMSCMESVTVNGVEAQCGASFTLYEKLRVHLAAEHGIDAAVKTETVRCASVDDFLSWKLVYEANASAAYRIRSKALTAGKKAIYKCTRSGVYNPEGKGLRRLKSQGTSKLGRCCTSEIRVEVEEDGSVVGTIFPFHYGHGTSPQDLPHLRIPAADKAVAKEKLLKGVNASRIMQDMRSSLESCGDPSSSRAYWITRKDLTNMAASLGVSTTGGTAKSKNEVISVEMHAEEMRLSDQTNEGAESDFLNWTSGRRRLWKEASAHIKKIQRRHDAVAKHLSETTAAVARVTGATLPAWQVTSDPAASGPEPHTVEQLHRSCPLPGASCQQRCLECKVCVHMLQCTCHDWVGQKVICEHIHMVCLQDVELASQLARLQAAADAVSEAAEPPPASPPPDSPPPLLMPSVRRPVKNATPEYLAQKAKEFAEVIPSLPPCILEQVAEHFRQIDQLTAMSATRGQQGIHQQPLPSVAGDQRACNARLERQPTFRPSRPTRRPAAATVTSADVRSGRDTVAALRVDDVGRDRHTPGAPDHMY